MISSADVIALLLPLSGRQQAAGTAVRDGFLAAALAEPPERRPRIDVYDTAALGTAAAYQRALASGASAVAGPLLKEDVTSLASSASVSVPTVALNVLLGDAPPFLFQFSLDPEQEARAVARRIVTDGHARGIVLYPRNAWGGACRRLLRPSSRRPAGVVRGTGLRAGRERPLGVAARGARGARRRR